MIVGASKQARRDKNDIEVYAEGFLRGGTLVCAKMPDDLVD